MSKLIVVHGCVSSGKSTLCTKLFEVFPFAKGWSSDGIREELSGDIGGMSKGVTKDGQRFDTFKTFRDRVEGAMACDGIVIADSTGMSFDFVTMVNDWRQQYQDVTVVRLFCDYDTWEARELVRERPFTMPNRAYHQSSKAKFDHPADIEIDTSNLSPDEVFERFYEALTKGK